MARFWKDNAGDETYGYDFVDDLAGAETISSTSVTATSGLTVDADTSTGTEVKGSFSGGTNGADYKMTFQATTSIGRIREISHTLHVRDL